MITNDNSVTTAYDLLIAVNSDLNILAFVLEHSGSMPNGTMGELEHFVKRINERLGNALNLLDPPPPSGEA